MSVIAAASAANGAATRRNRRKLAVLFLLPATVMAIIGIAMGGYSNPSLVIGVIDHACTRESRALIAGVGAAEHMRIRSYTDQEKMRVAVFRGRLNAGVVIPSGWRGASDLEVYLSRASIGAPLIEATIDSVLSALARGTKPLEVSVQYPDRSGPQPLPLGFQYTAPANLVLFVMINGFISALGVVQLRRSGLAQRLLATPARTWELFAMLTIEPLQQMAVQAIFLILSARLFFGVHWGDPMGLVLLTGVLICFGASVTLFMGTVFRNPQQTTSLGPWIGVLLGMLGGCMWPLDIVPPIMKSLAHLSPAAWAMDGYLALVFGGASARAIMPDLAALLLFTVGLGAIGIIRLRPELSR
jgi:ABC-2 type transport system permease protein